MHAVVANVTINDREAAQAQLRDMVVPLVSGAPGFVAGYWVALSGNKGTSVAVFESEETAVAAAGQIQGRPAGPVSMDSVEVGEVAASA